MFDHAPQGNFRVTNARIVTPDRVLHGSLAVEGGRVAGLGTADLPGFDAGGDHILPGIVDLHTDHAETHVIPRSGVQWSFLQALSAHDAVMIAAGTTTVFDSLSVGATIKRPERREILGPLVEALEQAVAADLFRAEHLLHLRCEIVDPDTKGLVDAHIGRPIARLASIMDHTPGDRQSPDAEAWLAHTARDLGLTPEATRERMGELLERSARVGAEVRAHVVAAAAGHGVPVLSHDDRTEAQVEQSHAEGIAVAEFPTTRAAAERARALGLTVVMGAPNYLRGGSQSGNVAVRELLELGLVDALASDYVPRSLLDAVFAIAEDTGLPQDLPQAAALVSAAPARVAGLEDRGALTEGMRADFLRVRHRAGLNEVAGVWKRGQRVY